MGSIELQAGGRLESEPQRRKFLTPGLKCSKAQQTPAVAKKLNVSQIKILLKEKKSFLVSKKEESFWRQHHDNIQTQTHSLTEKKRRDTSSMEQEREVESVCVRESVCLKEIGCV